MMQPHRRSNRRPRNNKTTQNEAKSIVQAFIEANRVEKRPGKLYRKSLEYKEEDHVVPSQVEGFEYDKEMYKKRNEVERLFRRLKGFRRIFTRFEKLDVVFKFFIHFALIVDALFSVNRP